MYSMYIRLCFKSFRKLLLTVVNQYKDLIRILHLRIVGWLRQTNNANAACLYSTRGFQGARVPKSLYKTQNTIFFHTMTVLFSLHIAREGWKKIRLKSSFLSQSKKQKICKNFSFTMYLSSFFVLLSDSLRVCIQSF